jgi:PTS system fructose-specific IIC component/PTS system nitrogen regulatory IIA component
MLRDSETLFWNAKHKDIRESVSELPSPHGKSDAVKTPRVAFGMKKEGVKWDPSGDKVQLVFLIAVPEEQAGNEHLQILRLLAQKLIDEQFRNALLGVATKEEALQLLAAV